MMNARQIRPVARTILKIALILAVFLLLPRACRRVLVGDWHQFSPSYCLSESSLDGAPWYNIDSAKKNETEFGPFSQYVDGVCQEGNLVYVWVNGTEHPDYYCIDTKNDTCTRLNGIPPHVRFVTAKQFLQERW